MTTEPIDPFRQAAEDSVARRRVAMAVIATLGVLVVVNLALLSFMANLIWTDHQDRRAGEKQGAQIIGDLYASINRTDAQLAELTGQAPPPPIAPPSRTTRTSASTAGTTRPAGGPTTTRGSPAATQPATTTTTRPGRSSTSTTSTTGPPPATTTTSTTRPCVVTVTSVARLGC